jgi:hypothetical protein
MGDNKSVLVDWRKKLERSRPPFVSVTDRPMFGIEAGVKMLISSPKEVQEEIAGIPKGKSVSVPQLRERLARKHGAEVTCPLTTGIFLRIVAEAALDEHESGTPLEKVTPFWRAIGPKDKIAKKVRCGPEWIARQREAEGIA